MPYKVKYWSIILLLFASSCKKEHFAVVLLSKFNKDEIRVEYDHKILFDSIISTNYSIMRAHAMAIQKQKEKVLTITLNNRLSQDLIIDQDTKVVLVRYRNDSLILEKSGPLKGPWY